MLAITMAETKPGERIERRLQHDADELDERIGRLDDHIGEAKRKAVARQEEGSPFDEAAGDWDDTEPEDSTGEDASAFDDPEADDEDEEA